MSKRRKLYLDYESRAMLELAGKSGVGMYRYIYDERTEFLFAWYAFDEEEPKCWRIWEKQAVPDDLLRGLNDTSVDIVAFNSGFERHGTARAAGIVLPPERFLLDPQVGGRYLSMPGKLAEQCKIMKLPPELSKHERGDELIDLFCKPVIKKATKKREAQCYFNDWNSHPEEWAEFLAYGRNDIISERELLRRQMILGALPLPEFEQQVWVFDQNVNDRGIPVDVELIEKAFKIATRAKEEATTKFEQITGVTNANSPEQVKAWAKTQGYPYGTLRKETVEAALKNSELKLTKECREALELRRESASTSYMKLEAILKRIMSDGTLKGQFIYMGSERCGRWAGNAVQLHNLPRPGKVNGHDFEKQSVVREARRMVYAEDYAGIKEKYKNPLLVIKNLIRTVFVADPLEAR
jgi:DNA polymerase